MNKKYNNSSLDIKDWTTKKLKEEAHGYYFSIYISECYGKSDLMMYIIIFAELENRGYSANISNKLTFTKI